MNVRNLKPLRLPLIVLFALAGAGTAVAGPPEGKPGKPANASKGQMQQSQTGQQKQVEQQERVEQQKQVQQQKAEQERVRAEEKTGNETSAEMQARKEERKQIQNEYKTAKQSGEGEAVKGQKPWWKFWESDAGS